MNSNGIIILHFPSYPGCISRSGRDYATRNGQIVSGILPLGSSQAQTIRATKRAILLRMLQRKSL